MNGWHQLYQQHRVKVHEARKSRDSSREEMEVASRMHQKNMVSQKFILEAFSKLADSRFYIRQLHDHRRAMVRARRAGTDPIVWKLSYGD